MPDVIFNKSIMLMILVSGMCLLVATLGVFVILIKVHDEVELNRKTGCISRFLNGEQVAQECEQYIRGDME